MTQIPFDIPDKFRFEHSHVVGGTGAGKSQLIGYYIKRDLEQVARGNASVIVIDSQGENELIGDIIRLKCFAPGQPLAGKLLYINPEDLEYPVCLNLFSVGQDRAATYSMLQKERLLNSTLEMFNFIFSSLIGSGSDLTGKQSVLYNYVTQLMLSIPGATVLTLADFFEDDSFERFREHIERLPPRARTFFEREFGNPKAREYQETRSQIRRRLDSVLQIGAFERMMSHSQSKIDLFTEMNAGKVIVINTSLNLLKENGTQTFGRFFLALILLAAQERTDIAPDKRIPTWLYIDEATDYFDSTLGRISQEARKYKLGMLLAHQGLYQLSKSPGLADALASNTSIKHVSGVSADDARTLARQMNCDEQFIRKQPNLSFATHIKNYTDKALALKFPYGSLKNMPRMTDGEFDQIRAEMRARYAVPHASIAPAPIVVPTVPPPLPPRSADTIDHARKSTTF